MKIFWATILFFIFSVSLLFRPVFAFAVSTNEEIDTLNKQIEVKKKTIQELEDTIAQYKKNIEQKQTEATSLKNQLGILDNHTAQLEAELDLTREQIKSTELQIDSLNIAIKQKEDTISKQKLMVTTLVQHLNAEGNKQYIEILLTNEDFSDFFDKVKYLEKTYIELGSSVKALKTAKTELDKSKKQVEGKKSDLLALKEIQDNKKKDLQDQATIKTNLLVQTKSSELKYRTMVDSLKKQYQAVENELSSYEQQIKKKLEAQNKIVDSGSVLFAWPVPSHYITASFEDPEYPFRNVFSHKAIDVRASQGTAIKAAASGYIGRAKRCTTASCYSYVLIVHTGSLSSVYGHMSRISVTEEQFVNKGDIIGYSGGTPGTVGAGPFVTGAHLHFEVRLNGIPVNPMGYLVQ